MKYITLIALFMALLSEAQSQDTTMYHPDSIPDIFYLLENVEREGVSMPEIELEEVRVVRKVGIKQRFHWWRYKRLVYNVKKVYPYALLVRNSLEHVNDTLELIPDDKDRRKYLKQFEKSIFAEYEGDMRQMTITQGRILIKLVDRETQNTGFELIKDYRGSVSAVFWQGIARIFGTNLKVKYDGNGDDYLIEKVIYEIEAGRL